MTNLEHKIANIVELDMAYDKHDYQIDLGNHVDISFSRGVNQRNIKDIEDKCNLEFVSVLPYQKYSGASWISLSFKTK